MITPVSTPRKVDINKVIKTLKKFKKALKEHSVTEEEISGDVKISEEQHKALDDKRNTIMSQSTSPKERSRAILNDVIVPTLMEIKPGAKIQKKLDSSEKPLSLQEFTDKITTSINQDIDDFPNDDEIDDNMGFEGDADVYIVSRKLLPPIDMAAVGPMGSDFVALDTPEGSPVSTELDESKNKSSSKRADTPTANPFGDRIGRLYQRFAGNPKATKLTVRQLPNTGPSGGKKHKTFKNKLRNRNKK